MIKVLLVDDHPVVRAGYRRLLEQSDDIRVDGETSDAESGYRAYCELAPDVCVSDLSLPGCGGLELLRRILVRAPDARVLIFSMHDSPQLVERAFEGGALGFVSKSAQPNALVQAVRAVHGGSRYVSDELLPAHPSQEGQLELARLRLLTEREFEVLRLLARGISGPECGRLLNLSPKTIANHQSQIKEKLQVSTSAGLVHFALRHSIIGAP